MPEEPTMPVAIPEETLALAQTRPTPSRREGPAAAREAPSLVLAHRRAQHRRPRAVPGRTVRVARGARQADLRPRTPLPEGGLRDPRVAPPPDPAGGRRAQPEPRTRRSRRRLHDCYLP